MKKDIRYLINPTMPNLIIIIDEKSNSSEYQEMIDKVTENRCKDAHIELVTGHEYYESLYQLYGIKTAPPFALLFDGERYIGSVLGIYEEVYINDIIDALIEKDFSIFVEEK